MAWWENFVKAGETYPLCPSACYISGKLASYHAHFCGNQSSAAPGHPVNAD